MVITGMVWTSSTSPQLQVPSGSTPAVPAPFPPAKSSPARRLCHLHGKRHLLTLRRSVRPPARLLPSRGVSGPGPGDRPPPSPPPPHPRRPPARARLASAAQRPAAASPRAGIRATRTPPLPAPPRSKDAGPRWLCRPLALHAPDTQDADTRPASRARAPQPASRHAARLPAEGLLRGPTPGPALLPAADASASGAHGMAAVARA